VVQLVEVLRYKSKAADLIPDSVIGIFHRLIPSGLTLAVRSTQPLIEKSTKNISCGLKAACA
jgi:hypothetical protein